MDLKKFTSTLSGNLQQTMYRASYAVGSAITATQWFAKDRIISGPLLYVVNILVLVIHEVVFCTRLQYVVETVKWIFDKFTASKQILRIGWA